MQQQTPQPELAACLFARQLISMCACMSTGMWGHGNGRDNRKGKWITSLENTTNPLLKNLTMRHGKDCTPCPVVSALLRDTEEDGGDWPSTDFG